MLTRKQHELLTYLQRYLGDHGVSPSFDEMRDALGLKSKSGIHRLITGLEERGFIRRLPHRARAIEVLRLPEDASGRAGFAPAVIQGGRSDARGAPAGPSRPAGLGERAVERSAESSALPLYGRIAAGTPIEALRNEDSFIEVPPALIGRGKHYALEVEGDSMIDAGIHDGDTVIIEETDYAENGAIVVALVDGEEVTLKRLRRRQGAVALEPANVSYETRLFPPDRVTIQGRLVGLIRRY
jgi:repressor LexA